MAPNPGPLCNLGIGDHAAADAGEDGGRVLRALDAEAAEPGFARSREQ